MWHTTIPLRDKQREWEKILNKSNALEMISYHDSQSISWNHSANLIKNAPTLLRLIRSLHTSHVCKTTNTIVLLRFSKLFATIVLYNTLHNSFKEYDLISADGYLVELRFIFEYWTLVLSSSSTRYVTMRRKLNSC